ncbi:MAG: HAD-IA family hydrolase [Pseudomonadota bacterium]
MTVNAVLFGSIGTLVETSNLQRIAFNQAFAQAGLDWEWDNATYHGLLKQSGGRQRIADYANLMNVEVDADAIHAEKSSVFQAMLSSVQLTPRPGVRALIDACGKRGISLGFVTTTSAANVEQVLNAIGETVNKNVFGFIGHGAMVERGKPAPDIYRLALERLGHAAETAVAIEDSETSMHAALEAGIRCIAFPGAEHADERFDGALEVVPELQPASILDR